MKKTRFSLLIAAIALAVTSCDSLKSAFTPTKMDTIEATTKVADAIKKNIDFKEWKIYKIYWMEGESLENDLFSVHLEMINKSNGCFTQSLILGGQTAGTVTDLRDASGSGVKDRKFDEIKGITPEMINAETIQKQYDAAKASIPEEYEFRSIGSYTIAEAVTSGSSFLDRDKKLGEISCEFEINVIEPGKEYVESAGKKSLQYYQVDFKAFADGTVEMDE